MNANGWGKRQAKRLDHEKKVVTIPRCSMCRHPDHELYEAKIVSGEITQTEASRLMSESAPYRVDVGRVSRHMKDCVAKRVVQLIKPEPVEYEGINVVNALSKLQQTTDVILQDSLAEGDRKHALESIRTSVRILDLMAKVTGQYHSEGPQFNLLLSNEWITLKQTIISAVEPLGPDARISVSAALAKLGSGNDDD
jgi:hypothetical protein